MVDGNRETDSDVDGDDDDYEDGSDDGAVVDMSVELAISGIDREPCYSRITLLRDLHSCYRHMMMMTMMMRPFPQYAKKNLYVCDACLFVTWVATPCK